MKRLLTVVLAPSFFMALASSPFAKDEPRGDRNFVRKALVDGMFEVEAGKIAVRMGQSEDVRTFGQRMAADYAAANEELTKLSSVKGVKAPTELDGKGKSQTKKLSKLSAARFDRQYVDMMVKNLKEDVKAFATEAQKDKDSAVKAFAAKRLPVLEDRLQTAEQIAGRIK